MAHDVIAFGEALWDLLPSGEKLGGAPLNFAYRMASLGRRTALVTRLGADALGDRARAMIAGLGLDTEFVQSDAAHATGTVPVTFGAAGIPDYTILPDVAYDYIQATDRLLEAASGAKCLCFGTLAQRGDVSRETLRRLLAAAPDAVKVYDVNLRRDCYTRENIDASLRSATIFKLNDGEVREVGELFGIPFASIPEFCRAVLERWPVTVCIVTLGPSGALGVAREESVYSPGRPVTVVDTIGSGDAFTAGFSHQYLSGAGLARACAYGNALGALVASTAGGTAAITPEQIEAFLAAPGDAIVDPAIQAEFAGS